MSEGFDRICKCGQLESAMAWEMGGRACPACRAVWPENLKKRQPLSGVFAGGKDIVRICYTNWRGRTEIRTIRPERLFFGSNEWHTTPQWLLEARDMDKGMARTFAMQSISKWWDDTA